MKTNSQNCINKKPANSTEAVRLLLQKINANVVTDDTVKRRNQKAYVSWPQDRK